GERRRRRPHARVSGVAVGSGRRLRSGALFAGGLAGIAYETLAQAGERPTLLILFAAMIGLPAFLQIDENRKEKAAEDKEKAEAKDGGEG
ncbi:MAG TPA: hypothetical protein VFR23_00920, partial [Jiangellaceae bacterium]|nr:hypothetical protein [Jiangellaceae bacterium]